MAPDRDKIRLSEKKLMLYWHTITEEEDITEIIDKRKYWCLQKIYFERRNCSLRDKSNYCENILLFKGEIAVEKNFADKRRILMLKDIWWLKKDFNVLRRYLLIKEELPIYRRVTDLQKSYWFTEELLIYIGGLPNYRWVADLQKSYWFTEELLIKDELLIYKRSHWFTEE